MDTLSERLADTVACDSWAADNNFDVRLSSRSALHPTHDDPLIHESLTASLAIGAAYFRDGAMLMASL